MKKYKVVAMNIETYAVDKVIAPLTWAECETVYNNFADMYYEHNIVIIPLFRG